MSDKLIVTQAMLKQRRWDEYFMDLAVRSAQMSHCNRLKVGAVAVRDSRPILTGWNGTAPGDDNCCEEEVRIEVDDVGLGGEWITRTKSTVNHAERNLIEFAAQLGIPLKGATLYITHAPCIECAKSIRNSGFVEVVYKELYRCDAGLNYLKNLKVRQYEV